MACDEALLEAADRPVLRIFRWQGAWISAGCFTDLEEAMRARPGLPFCRRWTGGGVVVHDGDFTFALIAPRGEALAGMRTGETYRAIHRALAEALRDHGIETGLSATAQSAAVECFAGAVEHDLVIGGTKIAGGAQRRTRRGVLHQGSVQGLQGISRLLGETLARTMGTEVETWAPPSGFEERVEALAAEKYASPEFLRGPRKPKSFTAAAMS